MLYKTNRLIIETGCYLDSGLLNEVFLVGLNIFHHCLSIKLCTLKTNTIFNYIKVRGGNISKVAVIRLENIDF